jgi:cytochrome c biogenesis protein CcmG/thiol:disulfide interchange protein DsbE
MGRDEECGAWRMKILNCRGRTSRSIVIAGEWVFLASIVAATGVPNIAWSQHSHVAQTSAPTIGSPAVGFELKSLDGKSLTLEGLRDKPLVLNFFASWCDPCRDEMPLINELAAAGDNGSRYSVVGIAVEDTRGAVAQFVKEASLGFPVALDLNSTVKRAYRIFGPPATFFIDRQGVIRDIVLGPVTRERAREALRKASVS